MDGRICTTVAPLLHLCYCPPYAHSTPPLRTNGHAAPNMLLPQGASLVAWLAPAAAVTGITTLIALLLELRRHHLKRDGRYNPRTQEYLPYVPTLATINTKQPAAFLAGSKGDLAQDGVEGASPSCRSPNMKQRARRAAAPEYEDGGSAV